MKNINWINNLDHIKQLVRESITYAEVCRKLGRKPVGGSITNVKRFCLRHGIDTSHMLGQGSNKNKIPKNKKSAEEILKILPENSYRAKPRQLKRAMLSKGIELKCNVCGRTEWLGKPMPLEIDHINSNYLDNRLENLQFICPNCHTVKTRETIK